MYNRTTPEEQRWIVRIILKDMNISVKETTIFSVFHPNAQDLFNSCSDLKKVAWELWDPSRRLNEEDTTVRIFSAFAPMLCRRPTKNIDETVKEMQGAKFIIEEKLDGERMQLHKRGNEFFYCSRKGKDYTYLYGKHIGEGSLTPFIGDAFDSRVHSIILDGEMLVWDPISNRNLPFGTLKSAALDKTRKQSTPRPCFKVFDLLYLNGQSILKKSTMYRKKNMRACIKEVSGRLEFTKEFSGTSAKDIREKMDEVMNDRGEGLVIKHPSSEYGLNARNKDWIKVKPEYMDNLGETFDLLVVAGSYGSRSKRSGAVSTLVCAAFEDRGINEDDPTYTTFVRIGTGLSYADYLWVRSKPWKEWDKKNPPSWLRTAAKGDEDKGDLYLEPQDSFIIKVKAAEITAASGYHIGWTMRFPRAVGIRDDLTIMDCASATAVLEHARSLTNKRKVLLGEMDSLPSRKKRKTVRTAAKPTILPQYAGPSLKDIPVQSDLFEGKKFKVEADPKSFTGEEDKAELVKLIHTHGGALAQVIRPARNFFIVFEGKYIPHGLQLAINKGLVDVIRPNWIKESAQEAECVPFETRHFFAPSDDRRETEGWDDVNFEDVAKGEDDEAEDAPKTPASPAERASTPKQKEEEDQSPWFRGESSARPGKSKRKASDISGSDTESESDYDSDGDRNAGAPDLEGAGVEVEDEWVGKEEDDDTQTLATQYEDNELDALQDQQTGTKMGEDDDTMHYDTELIFRHLMFYLDTPPNAQAHNITVKTSKFEKAIVNSFAEIEEKLTSNGARVTTSLDDPKLTHVILDTRDTSRRTELNKRTSKPKRRYLVVSDWVDACLGEETLLEESEFAP